MSVFLVRYWAPQDPVLEGGLQPRQTEWICPPSFDQAQAQVSFERRFPGSLVVDCDAYSEPFAMPFLALERQP